MKIICALFILAITTSSFACQNRVKRFKDVRVEQIKCNLFDVVELVEPKILHHGEWIRMAFRTVDGSGQCPTKEFCFMPAVNIDRKLDFLCRKFGFKRHSTSKTYLLHSDVHTVALINVNSIKPVPYTDKLSTLKKIYCQ